MTDTFQPATQAAVWQKHLTGLPDTWPKSLKEQAADSRVRTAIRDAYLERASVDDLCAHTGRSRGLVRLILVEEKVLRGRGGSLRPSAVQEGHASWTDAAATVLRERITGGRYPLGSPLPSVRVLSAELNVRSWAVQGAVHRLKDEELLLPVPSYGTVVTTPGRVPDLVVTVTVGERTEYWPLPYTASRRAERLRQTLLQQLADGTRTPGLLPEIVDLARQFALPQRTLGHVLAPLERQGLLAWGPQGLHVHPHARRLAAGLLPTGQEEEGEERAA